MREAATDLKRPSAPLIAVIVPAYQVERFVLATLQSVQAQTCKDWECIVVNDGSLDGTADVVSGVVATDPRIRLVDQRNLGLSGARNTGMSHVTPGVHYVAFLDSDDAWCEDALERLVAALRSDPAAVGSYGYAELMDEAGSPIRAGIHPARQRERRGLAGRKIRPVSESEPVRFEEFLVVAPTWPPAVVLHRREVVDVVGLFDTNLKQLEDWDFYIRMSRHGVYLPICRQVAWYREHAGQMTKRRAEFWHSHDVVRRKTWESTLNTPSQRRSLVRVWRWAQKRRIARTGQRVMSSLRLGEWRRSAHLTRGLALLIAQCARPGPPVARRVHVEWAGRDV